MKKQAIWIIIFAIICAAGMYWSRDMNRNINNNSIPDDDGNVWEKEFYHCAEYLMSRIEQVDASEYVLPEFDERHKQEKIEVYSASWQAYMSFVANWVQRVGYTPMIREDIYQQAALLMVLIDDNHDANYGFRDNNREYYQFLYDHEKAREELLLAGNQALQMENIIDEGFERIREEFNDHVDNYGVKYTLEANAWEAEFNNCMKQYTEALNYETDAQVLRLWGEFVVLWAENNEAYAQIDAGSGMRIDMAKAKRECYRTATLLTVYSMEQNNQEYEFIYNIEVDRERLQEITDRK